MKLRNKKTGEIVEVESLYLTQSQELQLTFTDEKNERNLYITGKISTFENEWEDYEEPKEYWVIDMYSKGADDFKNSNDDIDKFNKEIGNYFDTREETEKAVEKLKAWKRLKDRGFRFVKWKCENRKLWIGFEFDKKAWATETEPDLDLLFGGEE